MDARTLVQRFARAVASRNAAAAGELCAEGAWDDPRNSVSHLYHQLADREPPSRLAIDDAGAGESLRAIVTCTVRDAGGAAHGRVFVLCDGIPRRIAGWTESRLYAQRYLAGLVPAYLDQDDLASSPGAAAEAEKLADALIAAASGDSDAEARLAELSARSSEQVMGYLRHSSGELGRRLEITRALHAPALARVAIEAALVPDPDRSSEARAGRERLWLYAHEDEHALEWRDMSTYFDIDKFLA